MNYAGRIGRHGGKGVVELTAGRVQTQKSAVGRDVLAVAVRGQRLVHGGSVTVLVVLLAGDRAVVFHRDVADMGRGAAAPEAGESEGIGSVQHAGGFGTD